MIALKSSWWVPTGSFVLAVVFSFVGAPPMRALARRTFQDTTSTCFALADLKKATATSKKYHVTVDPPVQIQIDSDDSSHLSFQAKMTMTMQVTVTNRLNDNRTLILSVSKVMRHSPRTRAYSGATHKLDSFQGFDLSAQDLEKAAIDQAFAELLRENSTVPPPPNPFVFDNAKGKVATIDNTSGVIDIDGSFICDKTQEGQFDGGQIQLTLNAAGTGGGGFP
jgi:hypothetical protein